MKERSPEILQRLLWADRCEAGDAEPFNSAESSLPVESVLHPDLSEEIGPSLPETFVMASLEVFSFQGTTDFPQGLSHYLSLLLNL